jgi:integrase
MSLDLPGVSLQTISRDMFIFACFTGMAYTDVKHLKADKTVTMEDGSKWIITQRQKTGTPFSVRLMDIPLSIIDKYKGMATGGELFPMPKAGRVYYYLNLIARSCGMNKTLSFHMGRHTFASLITLSEGLPIETLCKMLGHKNIKTTQIYAELSLDKIAQEIQRLAERIRGKYLLVD